MDPVIAHTKDVFLGVRPGVKSATADDNIGCMCMCHWAPTVALLKILLGKVGVEHNLALIKISGFFVGRCP